MTAVPIPKTVMSGPTGPAPRRVLIVSPTFAPSSSADSQRVRMSLPYYEENGWEATVLAVAPEYNDAPREDALLSTLPSNARVHRVPAIGLATARRFGLGNLGWRAYRQIDRAGQRLLRDGAFDLVFFSTTQFAVLPLGRKWLRQFGVPYVIDLHDPWRTDYYSQAGVRKPPGGWKYRLAAWQARLLEPRTFRRMSGMISVSPDYLRDLSHRYSWFGKIPASTIPFGASALDLEAALRLFPSEHRGREIQLVYTGAAGPITPHAVSVLFEGFRTWRELHPESKNRIRMRFVGTSYAAPGTGVPTIAPLAEKWGLHDVVEEIPSRTGHLAGLHCQAQADGLLLLGSTDPAYSPSKLYPYFLSGRPMLAVVFSGSELEKSVEALGGAWIARARTPADAVTPQNVIHDFLDVALAGFPTGRRPARQESLFQTEYLARALTTKQAALFNAAIHHVDHARADG